MFSFKWDICITDSFSQRSKTIVVQQMERVLESQGTMFPDIAKMLHKKKLTKAMIAHKTYTNQYTHVSSKEEAWVQIPPPKACIAPYSTVKVIQYG